MRVRFFPLALSCLLISTPALAVGGRTLVSFGDSYSANGNTNIHRGIDVAMDSGSEIDSPVDGTVRFAGRIPAAGGGSTLAVTIDTGDRNVTLLPLASVAFEAGQEVSVGDALGTLAEGGDPSSEMPHLHLGMKRGDLYVDPVALLAVPTSGGQGTEVQQPAGTTAADPVPQATTAMTAGRGAVVQTPHAVRGTTAAGHSVLASVKQSAVVEGCAVQSGSGATARPGLAAGVSLAGAGAVAGAQVGAPAPRGVVAARLPVPIPRAPVAIASGSGAAHVARTNAVGGVLLAALLVVASVTVVKVAVRRRIAAQPRMSDRFGILVAAPVDR